jgi:hypothetical protein
MKKFIITVVVVAFVGAGLLGWWYMFHRLDGLFEEELQRAASQAFGTPVTVSDVQLNLLNGSLRIDDLAIGNPPGFGREHAVVFGSIEAAMDIQNMEVARVVLDRAEIYIEEKDGVTNVQQLKKALESRISEETGGQGGEDEEIVIQLFLMRSTTATFESQSLQRLSEVEIDQIEIRDLRGTPDEVAGRIATVVLEEIANEAGMAMLQAQARDRIDELGDKVGEKLNELLGEDGDDGQ